MVKVKLPIKTLLITTIIIWIIFSCYRYDHYATLCELLPISIPSLVACLRVWFGCANPGPSSLVRKNSLPVLQDFFYPGKPLQLGISAFLNMRERYRLLAFGDQ